MVSTADQTGTLPAPTRKRREGIKLWRAKDAVGLNEIMSPSVIPPEIDEQFNIYEAWSEGASAHVLFYDGKPDGCSITYVWFGPNCDIFRHNHSADCAYLVVSGQAILGRQVLERGDGFFVPGDAPYAYKAGPEGVEIIEFRPNGGASLTMNVLEDSPERWKQIIANANAQRELWRKTTPSFFPDVKRRLVLDRFRRQNRG